MKNFLIQFQFSGRLDSTWTTTDFYPYCPLILCLEFYVCTWAVVTRLLMMAKEAEMAWLTTLDYLCTILLSSHPSEDRQTFGRAESSLQVFKAFQHCKSESAFVIVRFWTRLVKFTLGFPRSFLLIFFLHRYTVAGAMAMQHAGAEEILISISIQQELRRESEVHLLLAMCQLLPPPPRRATVVILT